jgi:hypothetical protein
MPHSKWQREDPKWLAYAIQISPWTPREDLREALLYRAAIISAWASIETTLNELIIRSSMIDPYRDISEKFPYTLKSKLKYMRRALEIDGPFNKYRSLGEPFLDRFSDAADLRHLMAHAHMEVLGNWGATFTDFTPSSDGAITHRRRRYTPEQLEAFARRATRLSRLLQRGKYMIDQSGFLPAL